MEPTLLGDSLLKLTSIIFFSMVGFAIAMAIYPTFIAQLKQFKLWKQIRNDTVTGEKSTIFQKLHGHKVGTPTMGGAVILLAVAVLVIISVLIQDAGLINNSLINREETYVLLFWFFSMGILGLVDDCINLRATQGAKWMTVKIKFFWMFLFAGFISRWFYSKLWIDYINFWPLGWEVQIGLLMPIFTFFLVTGLVNAINFTDGLDGLAWGMMLIVLWVLGVMTFVSWWFLATWLIGAVIGATLAFLWFNINPAKIFMGDSWSLAFGGLTATLVLLLNIRIGIVIPFIILMILFWVEFGSSFFQILSKKNSREEALCDVTISPLSWVEMNSWTNDCDEVLAYPMSIRNDCAFDSPLPALNDNDPLHA